MLKRLFDITASAGALLVLSPLLLILGLAVLLTSKGGMIYRQQRVGRDGKLFWLYKFRSMRPASDQQILLTIGTRDNRITPVGYFLRKYKLDELPQLVNILKGDMSVVGPRPEVPRYVDMNDPVMREVLLVRPGLTDLASLQYFDESDLLAQSDHPEQTYLQEILPAKLALNQQYIRQQSFWLDLKIIGQTIARIVRA